MVTSEISIWVRARAKEARTVLAAVKRDLNSISASGAAAGAVMDGLTGASSGLTAGMGNASTAAANLAAALSLINKSGGKSATHLFNVAAAAELAGPALSTAATSAAALSAVMGPLAVESAAAATALKSVNASVVGLGRTKGTRTLSAMQRDLSRIASSGVAAGTVLDALNGSTPGVAAGFTAAGAGATELATALAAINRTGGRAAKLVLDLGAAAELAAPALLTAATAAHAYSAAIAPLAAAGAAAATSIKNVGKAGAAASGAAGAVGGLGDDVDKTRSLTERFSSGWYGASDALRKAGSQAQWTGRQLSVMFTMPTLLAVGMGTKWALDYEAAFTRIKKVYNGAMDDLGGEGPEFSGSKFDRFFTALSNTMGFSREEIAGVAGDLAQAGMSGAQLAKATQLVTEFSIVGDQDLAKSTQDLISVMAQYKMSADDLKVAIADLNAISNETPVGMADLTDGFVRTASVAREAGVDVRHLGAFIAALTPAAGTAAVSANGLKSIFTRLMVPTGDAAEMLAQIGIITDSPDWISKNAVERLATLSEKFEGLSQQQKFDLAKPFAGLYQINKFVALMDDMSSAHGNYQKALDATSSKEKSFQTYQQELNRFLQSNPQKLKIAGQIIKNSLADAIIPLVPHIVWLAQSVAKLMNAFSNLSPRTQKLIVIFALMLAAIGPLAMLLGSVMILFGALGKVIYLAAAAFMWLAKPLGIVGRLFSGLWGLVGRFFGMIRGIPAALVRAFYAFPKIINGGIMAPLRTILPRIVGIGAGIGTALGGPVVWAIAAITALIMMFPKTFGKILSGLPRITAKVFTAVVDVVKRAAMAVYEAFSYINPFARHSPSLVENVTGGMAIVREEFADSAKSITASTREAYNAISAFGQTTAGLTMRAEVVRRDDNRAKIAQADPSALPAYDALGESLPGLKRQLADLNATIKVQEGVVDALQKRIDAADKELDQFNKTLDVLQERASAASDALDAAKEKLDNYANAPLLGMRAMSDQIFANEMAQKRLRLEIMKLEDAGESVDDVKDRFAALQGQIETLSGTRNGLRLDGAGSDILSTYDRMIADLEAQQAATATATTSPIAKAQKELEELQRRGEQLDLENSLKFDPLTRQIQQMVDTSREMSFAEIAAGIRSTQGEIVGLTKAYDEANAAVEQQEAVIKRAEEARDSLNEQMEVEKAHLDEVKEAQGLVEDAISDVEKVMDDLVSAAEAVNAALEEQKRKAEEAADAADDLAAAWENAALGDFEVPGGTLENFADDTDIDSLTAELTDKVAKMFGGIDILGPVRNFFGRIRDAISGFVGGMFSPMESAGNGAMTVLEKIDAALSDLFGADFREMGDAFSEIWRNFTDSMGPQVWELLDELKIVLRELVPVAKVLGGIIVGALVLSLEVLAEVITHLIKPVFGFLLDIIHVVTQAVKGFVQLIRGAIDTLKGSFNVIAGTFQMIFGLIKGIATGDWSTLSAGLDRFAGGLVSMISGVANLFKGVLTIVDATWDAIYAIFKGAFGIVHGIVRGIVEGVYDFFYWLWDVLVGHSIVPDMINAIVDWFLQLPGRILKFIWNFIVDVAQFFASLPGKVWDALASLHEKLSGAVGNAFAYVQERLPFWIHDVVQWFLDLPGKIWDGVLSLREKLGGALQLAFDWLMQNLPGWIHDVVQFFLDLPGNIWDALRDKMPEIGKNIVEGLWNGIKGLGGWLKDKVLDWVEDHIPGPIKWALDINSPSGVTEEVGKNVGQGLVVGMDGQGRAVQDSAQRLVNGIGNVTPPAIPMNQVFNDMAKNSGDANDKLRVLTEGLAAGRGGSQALQDVMQSVNDTMRDTPSAFEGFNASMIGADGLIDTSTESGSKLYSQMKDVQGAFEGAATAAWQSAITQGASSEEAARKAEEASGKIREQFIQQAIDAGVPEEAARRLADGYKLLSGDIYTKFNVNLDELDEEVRSWIEQERVINFRANINEVNAAARAAWTPEQLADNNASSIYSGGGVPKRAGGGWIDGPGTTTSDSILALVSNREFVVNARQAARYAAILEQINAGTYDASAALMSMPRFADGGAIGSLGAAMATAASGSGGLTDGIGESTEQSLATWRKYVADVSASSTALSAQQKLTFDAMGAALVATNGTTASSLLAGSGVLSTGTQATYTAMSAGVQATMSSMSSGVVDTAVKTATALTDSFSRGRDGVTGATGSMTTTVTDQFGAMATNLRSIFDNELQPMFNEFDPSLKAVSGWFGDTVGNIGTTWAGIKEPVAVPARFIVNDVYNDGIRGAWNKFNTFLGLEPLAEHVARFALGGPIRGAGTGTSDSILARVANGEHVVTAAEVRGAGGHRAIEAARAQWKQGLPAFAAGGPVDLNAAPWGGGGGESNLKPAAILARRNVHKYWPSVGTIGGYRAQDVYPDHPSGLALDIMTGDPVGTEINDWLHREKDALALNYTIWKQWYKPAGGIGNLMEDRGSLTQNHMDHVHALFNANGVAGIQDGGVGTLPMDQVVRDAINAQMDAVATRAPQLAGGIGRWPLASVDKARAQLLEFMVPKAAAMAKATSGAGTIGNAESWRAMAIEAMKRNGFAWQNKDQVDAMLRQIMTESTGNPSAFQKVIDINSGGNEAAGLLQITPRTWAAYRDPELPDNRMDPWASMNAALRYYKARYGMDLTTNWGNGIGYDQGGVLQPTPGGYGTYYNHTGKPEAVLTSTQWDMVGALAGAVVALGPEMISQGVELGLKAAYGSNPQRSEAEASAAAAAAVADEWTPLFYGAASAQADAATAQTDAAKKSGAASDRISEVSKAIGTSVNSLAQLAAAIGAALQVPEADRTFETLIPILNAAGDFLGTLPQASATYVPWAGTDTQMSGGMRVQKGFNDIANVGKGLYNVVLSVAPAILKSTATIGAGIAKLAADNGPLITAALAMLPVNPVGAAITLIPVLLQGIATILPAIIEAITQIVPALFSSILRFFEQFMPDSVYAHDSIEAAEKAAAARQEQYRATGTLYDGPTVQQDNSSQVTNMNVYVSMPNVTNGDDADLLVANLKSLAGN